MNAKDMLAMFDLGGKEKPPALEVVGVDAGDPKGSYSDAQTVSETAVQQDAWDLERGERTLKNNRELWGAGLPALAVADFHAACYKEEPELVEHCSDPRRREYLKALLETPEHQALRTSTVFKETASEVAAAQLCLEFAKLKEKDEERNQKPYAKTPKGEAKKQMHADMDLLGAVGRGAANAAVEVEELEEAMRGLGGDGGDPNGKLDAKQVAELFKRVRNSNLLKRILELAGRYRRVAQAKQQNKTIHGYDDMVGITVDDDPSKLLACELARLDDPDLELETLLRITSKQAMARQYIGVEKLGKGPIVVCVDESGSMAGERVCNAKAFSLAMAWIAKRQRRWCCLVGFAGGTEGTRLVLKPDKWDEAKLMDWLEHFYSGGTVCDVPLVELPTTYWKEMNPPKGKVDVIMVTDAIVRVPYHVKETFLAWKKQEQVKVHTLVIGERRAGDLAAVSDETYFLQTFGLGQEGVENCLAI